MGWNTLDEIRYVEGLDLRTLGGYVSSFWQKDWSREPEVDQFTVWDALVSRVSQLQDKERKERRSWDQVLRT